MLSLLLSLLVAAQPQAAPVPRANTVIRAADYGVDGAPTTEAASKIQAILDALPDPANCVIEVPGGAHYLGHPIEIRKDGVTLRGAGERLTLLQAAGPFPAIKVGRFAGDTSDGFAFGAGGRPDLYGLADSTLAPTPGRAWGFATQTRTVLATSGLGLDLGRFDPDWGWDYWASKTGGLTVEGLVKGTFPPGSSLCGIGTTTDPVGPGVLIRNSQATNALTWFVACDDEAEGTAHAATFDLGTWPTVLRFRLWYDAATGEVGLWANGKSYSPSWYGGPPKLAGRRLRLNRKGLPFVIGASSQDIPQGAVPDATWGGLRVSSVPRRDTAWADAQLVADGPGVVAWLVTTLPPTGRREVLVREGQAAQAGPSGVALAVDTVTDLGAVSNTTLEDFTATNAAPAVLLGNTFDARIRRVTAKGGRRGLQALRYGCNYTLSMYDTTWEGSADAVNLYATFGVAVETNFNSGGLTSLVLAGSGLEWQTSLFSPQTHFPETAVSVFGNVDYDYVNAFRGVRLDNEVSPYLVANFYAETVPGGAAALTIEGGCGSWVAGGSPVVRLFGRAQNKPGRLKMSGFDFPQGDCPAVTVTGPKGKWTGTVDLPGLNAPRQPSGGEGFDPSKLLVK